MPPVPSTTVTVTATGPSQEQRQGGKLQDLLQGPDAQQWQARFNTTMADVGGVVNSKAPESAEPFSQNLFGCFGDIGLCLQGCLIPCVVFGKTHHRTRENARMEGYQPVNTTVSWDVMSSNFHWDLSGWKLTRELKKIKKIVPSPLRTGLHRALMDSNVDAARRHTQEVWTSGQLPG